MTDDTAGYGTLPILVSAVVGFAVATLSIVLLHSRAVFFEQLYRVEPTVAERGVGADWVTGNTIPWLDALVAVTHAADVIMGLFILVMVFVHWGAFRRLADRMQRPGRERTGEAVADGGRDPERPRTRAEGRTGDERAAEERADDRQTSDERAGDGRPDDESGSERGGDRR